MSNQKIFTSKDGSNTLYWEKYDEHYHSVHGALTESQHVFIDAGLKEIAKTTDTISIFEMGFGTGLNLLLTYIYAQEAELNIHYTSVEAYPLDDITQKQLNYNTLSIEEDVLAKIYDSPWNEEVQLSDNFSLMKKEARLQEFETENTFDLIYYDAFAPSAQPELWTQIIFEKLNKMLNKNGLLTTYCAKGQVKRDLRSAGFTVETLPGPPGKREMTRARKY